MTIRTRSGGTYGPTTPLTSPEPPDQPASTRGLTSGPRVAGPLAGLLRIPPEITWEIASHLPPRSRIALADSRLSLNAQLLDDRLATAIIFEHVPDVKSGEDVETVLQRIGRLPVSLQGKALEALGTHVYLQLTYPENVEAISLFSKAARAYTGTPSALLDAFRKAAENPGHWARLFRHALDAIENDGWAAQKAIKHYHIRGNRNHAMLLAAESYVSSDETPPPGYGRSRFPAFRSD